MTTIVPIYDAKGIQINQLEIDDDLVHVNGRVSKGQKHYYKGVGITYHSHSIEENLYNKVEYRYIRKDTVFYMGYKVSKKCFENKTGIFQEKYQPQFTDFIGACGVKELSIIENSIEFEKSSVEVIKSYNFDTVNQQYYFVLDYKCGRRNYLNGGNPKKLKELLTYMLHNDWNFIWDKRSITDITYNGLVSDVADLFHDTQLISKLGTVYSVLYSLGNMNPVYYQDLLSIYGLKHENQSSYVFNTLEIMKRNSIDISSLLLYSDKYENYKHIVLNYLINGRNCGHCSFTDLGERIKDRYILNAKTSFK